jgi:uncharacterized protein (TIGR00369 family)
MPATRWLLNSAGAVSGGVLAIVADAALGCALQTELGPATPYTTSELSMTMLRPVRPDGGTISANGQRVHRGRSVGLTEAPQNGPIVSRQGLKAALSCPDRMTHRLDSLTLLLLLPR